VNVTRERMKKKGGTFGFRRGHPLSGKLMGIRDGSPSSIKHPSKTKGRALRRRGKKYSRKTDGFPAKCAKKGGGRRFRKQQGKREVCREGKKLPVWLKGERKETIHKGIQQPGRVEFAAAGKPVWRRFTSKAKLHQKSKDLGGPERKDL